MRYVGMPAGMWALFVGSFRRQLTEAFGYDSAAAAGITKKAHQEYRALIQRLPAFEKGDRFQMNIVSCAMLSAFVLNMPRRPSVDELTRKSNLPLELRRKAGDCSRVTAGPIDLI